jgi:cytosine/uracil/thiamine/allantoin permease
LTPVSIENINAAVVTAMAEAKKADKMVQNYFNNLENKKLIYSRTMSLLNNVFIIVLTLIVTQMCYCVFKICFTPSNKIKSLFPTYKPRE